MSCKREAYARNCLYFRSKWNWTISDKNSCILNMQWGITKGTQITSSWTDMTISLVPGLQSRQHTVFCPSHTPSWFPSTPPVRADNVRATPKTSDEAEDTKHICSRLSKCLRHPAVGPVCSCLKSCCQSVNSDKKHNSKSSEVNIYPNTTQRAQKWIFIQFQIVFFL